MPNYRRSQVPGGTYFFTVNLLNRKSHLLVEEIAALRAAIRQVKHRSPFHIDAWVVLPDHMHCIWTLPPEDLDFSSRWRAIKNAFSRAMPPIEHRSPVRHRRAERGIWQHRFWEHKIRDDKDYAAHIDYVHFNPVKHRFVDHPKDWPLSTFHRAVKNGLYPPDWMGNANELPVVGERDRTTTTP